MDIGSRACLVQHLHKKILGKIPFVLHVQYYIKFQNIWVAAKSMCTLNRKVSFFKLRRSRVTDLPTILQVSFSFLSFRQ